MGDVGQDLTQEQAGLSLFMKKAQEHVDTLAAQNQLAAVYADTQNQLSKTQNSRDVEGVIEQSNKTLNEVSARWSKSPAVTQIQMNADALRPDLSRIGTVRQVDLMGKEFKITIDKQAELLAGSYATDRAAGGKGDAAEGAFNQAVDGGVQTGLVGTVEADEYKRRFRQQGQELQIKNGIANANPEVNQKTYDDITAHRDQFPDVTQEQLDTYKGQALSAYEAHTKFKDWAEGDMALKTQLVPKITQFTNPATGHFDEAGALTDNADRMAKGEITETQSKVLAQGFASHQAQLEVGLKTEANKRLDDIEKDLSAHKFNDASAKLEANQPWFENNGFGDDYRAALRYTAQKRTEVRVEAAAARTEARQDYLLGRQIEQEQSADTLGQVQHFIVGGGMLTKSDLYNLAGTGPGKMRTQDVDAAWKIMQSYEKEPDFAAAMKQLDQSFPISKTATADQAAAQNRKYAETVEVFQQQVNEHPDQSKQEIMNNLLKSQATETIKQHANAMFGTVPTSSKIFGAIKDFITAPFTYGLKPGDAGYKAPPTASSPARPKTVPDNYQWNPSGNGGKGSWQPPKQ
jgi:hypothetical protein